MKKAEKAVIVIDVQRDFIDGALGSKWAKKTTPKIVKFIQGCMKDKKIKVYATRDTHYKNYLKTLEGKKLPIKHCIEDTSGWMLDDKLMEVLEGKTTIINKETFGSTDLLEIIAEDIGNPKEIVLVGFVTDICVVINALLLRTWFPDAKISVMKDLCAGTTKAKHKAALETMSSCQIDVL